MGVLRARIHPAEGTDRADHAWVDCGSDRKPGWGCWGEAAGGSVLRSGRGSTRRADAIAGPEGRGGLHCYLINGISHQAANRILLPAGITVRGARGYGVSEALFGVYGRPQGLAGACEAPFDRCSGTDGELPGCSGDDHEDPGEPAEPHAGAAVTLQEQLAAPMNREGRETFALAGFVLMLQDRLGTPFTRTEAARDAGDVRLWFERAREPIEQGLVERPSEWPGLVEAFDRLTGEFLERMAEVLAPAEYADLFELEPGEPLSLVDPDIAEAAYRRA